MKTIFTLHNVALAIFCSALGVILGLATHGRASFGIPVAMALAAAGAIMLWLSSIIPDDTPDVDIWKLQRKLMEVSDQRLPPVPSSVLTKDLLLYYVLIMEETEETGRAIWEALNTFGFDHRTLLYMGQLNATVELMHGRVGVFKQILDNMPDFSHQMTPHQAEAVFDGIIDITVTAAGASLAAGLPGSHGYLEVFSSNMSKVNPLTGKISKTRDGKWIKGARYVKPNLAALLNPNNALYSDTEV